MGIFPGLSKRTRLKIAMVLTTIMFFGEVIFGFLTHSIALVADSFHMCSDVMALGIAHYAITLSTKKKSHQRTYGYQRAETLGALINATFLLALCFTIVLSSVQRFFQPEPITNPTVVLIVGGIGLAVNVFSLMLFHDVHHDAISIPIPSQTRLKSHAKSQTQAQIRLEQQQQQRHAHAGKLNMRGAFLHVLGDALGSVGVIIVAVVIKWVPWKQSYYLDPIMSILIAVIIVCTTWPLFRKTAYIVLHVVPPSIQMENLEKDIMKLCDVVDVHEFHVWQLSDLKTVASIHIVLRPSNVFTVTDDENGVTIIKAGLKSGYEDAMRTFMELTTKVKKIFHSHGIHNTTIQLEMLDDVIAEKHNNTNTTDGNNGEVRIGISSTDNDCLISCGRVVEDTKNEENANNVEHHRTVCHIVTCCPMPESIQTL